MKKYNAIWPKYKKHTICALCLVGVVSLFTAINALAGEYRTIKQQQELAGIYNSSSSSEDSTEEWRDGPNFANERFHELYKINPDVVGWLNIADGALTTPVVQRDNNYYLKHDFYGKSDDHGAVFLDERNGIDPNDDSLILYGHNMRSSMFNVVAKYQTPEFCAQYPVIDFDTLEGTGQYVIASVFIANVEPQNGETFDYHLKGTQFQTFEDNEAYIVEIMKRSLVLTGVDFTARDEFITLSTCGYDFEGERIVVVARKLREDESKEQFAHLTVTKNPNAVMPEIWEKLYG
ncbi:MAG: class B sortase [Angelakisella sp.]|nr:class B sortase [Angelakisella sp.]